MKVFKWLILLSIFSLLALSGSVSASQIGSGNQIESYICGDMNGDGNVNVADISYFVKYIYSGGPSPVNLKFSDVNGSGTVNYIDLTYLVYYLFWEGQALQCD